MRTPMSFPILLLAALVVAPSSRSASAATITVVNGDLPGVGFNDATPAVPVGGNPTPQKVDPGSFNRAIAVMENPKD